MLEMVNSIEFCMLSHEIGYLQKVNSPSTTGFSTPTIQYNAAGEIGEDKDR